MSDGAGLERGGPRRARARRAAWRLAGRRRRRCRPSGVGGGLATTSLPR
ncbi:hypothetical protein E2C01_049139 [Portunus trituberculatus]|uniref:Uncharacterized protein n=1 Tax=Portunus trituberculatus TaxID=210409 RepID=A0A5B7GD20_PORTR|nr:hypothetical protein [Portunus trituberculatus]